jgi:tRNA A-37 threonylcarbamoyl transferase component Bud32
MNMDPSTTGRVVGRYEILRQIGQGAMATVHLARQLDLDRAVALKELDRLAVGDSSPVASRFLREAHVAGSLSHASIVTVYEYFVHDGRPFIAMEFVEGGSLRRYLPGLTLNQIFGVLEDLLAALDHSESRGVVHRDIKPENMLVTVDGRIKIADFGIASAYGLVGGALLTATGATVGTPMYMAPEQATGAPTTIATDLYALGIVAFEMLLGQLPFGSAESPIAIIWQHVNGAVPDMQALRPDLDPRLCQWVARLLEKHPADRPASAAEALDALEEIALDLLGSRWRHDARLGTDVPEAWHVAPPAIRSRLGGRVAAVGVSAAADPHATRDANGARTPPARVEDEDSGRSGHPLRDALSSMSRARRSMTVRVVIVAVALIAAAGGYAALRRDVPRPAGNLADAHPCGPPTTVPWTKEPVQSCDLVAPLNLDNWKVPVYSPPVARAPHERPGPPMAGALLDSHHQFFVCQRWFAAFEYHHPYPHAGASSMRNGWWAFTRAENGAWGWTPEVFFKGGSNDDRDRGLVQCGPNHR